jgi:hypothetical protein
MGDTTFSMRWTINGPGNSDLKEGTPDNWSKRPETFDPTFGHKIAPSAEAAVALQELTYRIFLVCPAKGNEQRGISRLAVSSAAPSQTQTLDRGNV